MKAHKTIISFLFISFLISAATLKAEGPKIFSSTEIVNLIAGIKSDNNGLMRSSVYFAGKYKVGATVDALVEKLEREEEPSNLVLIALAIYKIGDSESMMKVLEKANSVVNDKAKRMLTAIAVEYLNETNTLFVLR